MHCSIAARHHDLAAVPELARQSAQLRDCPRQLVTLHRARRVDQETGPRARLVVGRHDEVAVTRLTPMRPAICAVVSTESALAERGPQGLADDREVINLR